jgi:hypothetical protein
MKKRRAYPLRGRPYLLTYLTLVLLLFPSNGQVFSTHSIGVPLSSYVDESDGLFLAPPARVLFSPLFDFLDEEV